MTHAATTPAHIAFIMDGNGRWAQARGLPRLEGHRQGVETVRRMVDALIERGVGYATFYAFSTENWKRPEDEVSGLFNLMRLYFRQEMKNLGKKGLRIRFIGDRRTGKLSDDIIALMNEVEAKTAANTKLTVQFAINYSGRDELLRAMENMAMQVEEGTLAPTAITDKTLAAALDTAGVPDPDLVIRTSGEQRISNFMLWQMAYSELYFTPLAWPDFTTVELDKALETFGGRERRFGGLKTSAVG